MNYQAPSKLEKIHKLLLEENQELLQLEKAIEQSLQDDKVVTTNVNRAFDAQLSFGDRLSDQIADFVGSWKFIIVFLTMGAGWILINILSETYRFDVYPFVLLNLFLSCVAAFQAPLIMMSQNRQEEKDRLRSEHDYKINLKAELEVRQLHMKMDQLLKKQWRRLLEIQSVQTEMLAEVLKSQIK